MNPRYYGVVDFTDMVIRASMLQMFLMQKIVMVLIVILHVCLFRGLIVITVCLRLLLKIENGRILILEYGMMDINVLHIIPGFSQRQVLLP